MQAAKPPLPGLAPGQPALSSPVSSLYQHPAPGPLPQESHPVLLLPVLHCTAWGAAPFPSPEDPAVGGGGLAVVRLFFSPAVQGLRGWPLSDAGQWAVWLHGLLSASWLSSQSSVRLIRP